jgi:cytochrome c
MLTSIIAASLITQASSIQRPRDIWVFRSVLDQNARMLTAALNDNLWVAYDTQTCSLYKAWTGGVKFDGAVYTTVHGPQPTSQGAPYILNKEKSWKIFDGESSTEIEPRYLGYKIVKNSLVLNFSFKSESGQVIKLSETPEYLSMGTDKVGLKRNFQVSGLKSGQKLGLLWHEAAPGSIMDKVAVNTTFPATEMDASSKTQLRSAMLSNGSAEFIETFAKSGTANGVTPPDDDGTDLVQEQTTPQPTPPQDQQDVSKQREPGLSLRVYWTGIEMTEIPELITGQTPNYSIIVPQLNLGNGDFGKDGDNFLAHVTGFINVDKAGTYEFELSSDDGSRMFIGDNLVIDHNGLHGKTPKTGSTELNKGENSIRIEMFEDGADEALELKWKKPGDKEFTLVPASAFTTPAGEVRVTAPGKKGVMGIDNFRPGDRRPLEDTHPAYTLSQARPNNFHPRVGGIGFLPNKDMLICTWDADGAVYQIHNWDKSPSQMTVKRIAGGLAEPLGLKVVDGRTYVLQKQELTELIDLDNDGIVDEYRCVANGWKVSANFHEFAFGLEYSKGKFYGNLATAINPGGKSTQPQIIDRGRTVEIDAKTGEFRFITAGLRTPNGIGFGALGKLYIADNQGDWLPSSKILLVKEGAFYGNRSVEPIAKKDTPEDPPVVWLPQNEIGNSPSQIAPLNHGPYKGQMVHGDVTHGGLKRVYVEEVDGVLQGCVFRFTQGLEAGINRVVVAPDGSFIVGGIGSNGNWGQTGKQSYGTQRLAYNNKSVFEMLSVSPRRNGLEIKFTEPLSKEVGNTPAYYQVKQWRYVPTEEYGGPKIDEEVLDVKAVWVSQDRKTAFLNVDGLKDGSHVAYVHCHQSLQSESKQFMWSTEAWLTINKIPAKDGPKPTKRVEQPGEPVQGNKLTNSMSNFQGWNMDHIPSGWTLQGGVLSYKPGSEGGDLRTVNKYKNFDMTWEWKIGDGGNSGVMYFAQDRPGQYPWQCAPEYQILDNTKHADGRNPFTSASAMYSLYRPEFDYTRPVGEWNVSRIVAKNGVIQHWLNHKLMVTVDMNSQEFRDKVAASKFKDMAEFGTFTEGYIVFQDHGDPVSYRNITIKEN